MEDVGVEKVFGGGAFGVDLGGRDGLSSDGVDRLKAGMVAESHHNLLGLSAFWIMYAGWGEKGIRCDGSVLYTKRIRFFKNNLWTRWKGRGSVVLWVRRMGGLALWVLFCDGCGRGERFRGQRARMDRNKAKTADRSMLVFAERT